MPYLSNAADARAALLQKQLANARMMQAAARQNDADVPDADWECVDGAINDTIASLEYKLSTIHEWDRDQRESVRFQISDFRRDMALTD